MQKKVLSVSLISTRRRYALQRKNSHSILDEDRAFMEQSENVKDEKIKGVCFLSDESDSDEDLTQLVDIPDNADQIIAADADEKLENPRFRKQESR